MGSSCETDRVSKKAKISRSVIDIHRDEDGPANRVGRQAIGLYPEIDRHKLAREIGCSASNVSYVLSGRHNCKLDMAVMLGNALGVDVEELYGKLRGQRQWWEENERAKRNGARRNGRKAVGAKR